jgi:quercetin dioxygenase-like cupin family protein
VSYTSKDFGRTADRLTVEMPDQLIHRQVEGSGADEKFSHERKHPVSVVDLPSRTLSMTIGGLLPGQITSRHRHNYETIIYVLEGEGFTTIEDRRVDWRAGDAVYIPVWAWHHHTNTTDKSCRYVACENAPLLQNLGAALREEDKG